MSDPETPTPQAPTALLTVLALACGAVVANLYYAQPLIGAIAPALGVAPASAGAMVSVTQLGYGLGLFFLVPLADLRENKVLVLVLMAITSVALLAAGFASAGWMFFAASLLIGLCSTGAQVLLPFVTHLTPPDRRGRVVGNVMAALLAGIMLARPAALFISADLGWRAVFRGSALLMLAVGAALAVMMPRRRPRSALTYREILGSMIRLLREHPELRWRSAYHALLFGAFNMFWTAVPLMLAQRFGLSERGVGLFALAGAGGALAAPVAGRLADRGMTPAATIFAMAGVTLTFFGTDSAARGGHLGLLVILAVLLDAAVQTNHVASQRIVFGVPGELRGRANALYMTAVFAGGALGSLLGAATFVHGGWAATSHAGALAGLVGLGLFAVETRGRRAPA